MESCDYVIDQSPLAMAVTCGPKHELRSVNDAFCLLQGMTATQMLGRQCSDVIRGPGVNSVLGLLDRVYRGESCGISNDLQFTAHDKVVDHKTYMVWGVPHTEAEPNTLVIQVTDFNEQTLQCDAVVQGTKDAIQLNKEIVEVNAQLVISELHQKSLADMAVTAELRWRNLVHGLNAVVCEIDLTTEQFTFVSEKAEMFLGYSVTRWTSHGFWRELIHPDFYETVVTSFQSSKGHHPPFRAKSASGADMWLRNVSKPIKNIDGVISVLRCILVDVTEQHVAHLALLKDLDKSKAIAEAMQYSILWHQSEKSFNRLKVAVSYEPASTEAQVGGDFFDAFSMANGSVMMILGDVTGKGLKAASRTVEIIFALRAFAQDYRDPADMLSRLNDFICDYHHNENESDRDTALVVLSIVVIDPATGETLAASAGAEPTMIVRATGDIEELSVRGLILGIDRNTEYGLVPFTLEVGDTLIMTTDGITESRRGKEFFGSDRVMEIAKNSDVDVHNIAKSIVDASREYCGGRFKDDVCLLLARREPVTPIQS